jgi:hypothetical protein
MPKVLSRLRVDEISAVDRGAGQDCRIVLYKRGSTNKRSEADMDDHLVEVCKSINLGDVTPPSEFELTQHIQAYCTKRRRDGESAANAFARILCGEDDTGLAFRKSLQIAKRHAGLPV